MSVTAEVWAGIGGDAAALGRLRDVDPPLRALPSSFAVEPFAVAAFAAVGLAIAELTGARHVEVDPEGAAAAVRSEQSVRIGDDPPEAVWDPLSRIYAAGDGWVRLHGNYAQHRAAIERALGTGDPDAVAAIIGAARADDIETRIHAAGGAAASAHTLAAWAEHPHGARVRERPLVETTVRGDERTAPWPSPVGGAGFARGGAAGASVGDGEGGAAPSDAAARPLTGLRVVELTRVIAGPVAGRTLSWFGADVIRIESPSHTELRTLIVDTGPNKRSAALDLRRPSDLAELEALIGDADVVLHGLRPGALDHLGLGGECLAALAPGLIDAGLSAYGPGPWEGRRGFDSLVQLSSGLGLAEAAAAGTADDGPRPLPAQILDHATGLLVAAAIIRAVAARADDGRGRTIRASLARTAAALTDAPRTIPLLSASPAPPLPGTTVLQGPFGTTRHVPLPVLVEGAGGGWNAGPPLPGTSPARWSPS